MSTTSNTKAAEVRDALLDDLEGAHDSEAVALIEQKLEVLNKLQD